MAGLFDGFEGFRVVSEGESRDALATALVAVDANVLLNLYRYNAQTTSDLFAIFAKLADRLVVPYQAMREFHRNRIRAIGNPDQATGEARTALEKSRTGVIRVLDTWSKHLAIEDSRLYQLRGDVDGVFQRLQEAIDQATPDRVHPATSADEDPVLSRLSELLADRVLKRPAENTWNALVNEGNQRVDDEIPPGYLDADKGDHLTEGAAGDFLVYAQACHEAKSRQMDLIIVTNDEKEDWWWRRGTDMIGPRPEMTKEFFDKTGRRLFLMRASDLLKRSEALDVDVSPQSARDAEVNRSNIAEAGSWTPEAIELLLQRLRGEGRRDIAAIIIAAAAAGGSINREEIYVLCDYRDDRDDRKLRGITRPAARITADLQAEGVLPLTVAPMMRSVFVDAGQLTAIRVPAEVADILGTTAVPSGTDVGAEHGGK